MRKGPRRHCSDNKLHTLLFLLNTPVIVSVIFYWDACIAPVNICDSGFILLVRHVC